MNASKIYRRSTSLVAVMLAVILLLFASPVSAITFGQPDTNNTYANTGAVIVHWSDGNWYPWCSGSLAHPMVFLTAGHCTNSLDYYLSLGWITLDDIKVSFSHTNFFDPATWHDVAAVRTHPDYGYSDRKTANHGVDVGLLVFEEAVLGITPVTLPPVGLLDQLKRERMLGHGNDKAHFVNAGYGAMVTWPPPQFLDSDGQRWFSYSEYRALNGAWLSLSQNNATGDGGTCYGDSGGPNFLEYNGQLIQVGITSWGDIPCIATNVVYRVDVPQTLGFIQSVVDSLE